MSKIPTQLSEEQFATYIEPHLSKAKRGFVSRTPLFKIFNYILHVLHTGSQWETLVTDPHPTEPEKKEITYHGVKHHYYKWVRDGSFEKVWSKSIELLIHQEQLDRSVVNLDGSHTTAKKGAMTSAIKGVNAPKPATSYR